MVVPANPESPGRAIIILGRPKTWRVFFLQTPKAASKWAVTTEKLNELRTSFRSKHRGDASGGAGAGDGKEEGGGGARTKERKRYQDNAEIQRQRREALHQTQVDPFKSKKKHKKI